RCSAGLNSSVCLCGGWAAGTNHTRSSPTASRQYSASNRCPRWTGSNEPPKMPSRTQDYWRSYAKGQTGRAATAVAVSWKFVGGGAPWARPALRRAHPLQIFGGYADHAAKAGVHPIVLQVRRRLRLGVQQRRNPFPLG